MQPEAVNPALFELAEAIYTIDSLRKILDKLSHSIQRILPPSSPQIALYDASQNVLHYFHHFQAPSTVDPPKVVSLEVPSETLTALTIKENKPLLLSRAEINSLVSNEKFYHRGNLPTSWLGIPIGINGQIKGIIVLENTSPEEIFYQKEIRLLCLLADQAAIAIDRQQNQIRYKDLLENIKDLVFATGSCGRLTYLSASTETITGYTPAELKDTSRWHSPNTRGKKVNPFVHEEDREYLAQILASAHKNLNHYRVEYRLRKKDGTLRWVSERGQFNRDHTRGVVLDGVITDIHDRRKTELVNKVLYTISNAVNSTQRLNELFTVIHETLSQLIPIEHFGIGLYDIENDSIGFTYNFDLSQTLHPQEIRATKSSNMLPAEVIRSSNLLYLTKDDIPNFESQMGQRIYETDFEAWLGVPLKVNDQVIGVMFSEIHHKVNGYSLEDMECFQVVADQVAIAMDRKASEAQINFREKIITTLYRISNAIHTSNSLYQLYKSMHEVLKPVLNTDTLTISFYDPKTDTLHFHYSADQIDLSMLDPIENVSKTSSLTYQVIKSGKSLLLDTEQKAALQKQLGGGMIGSVTSKCWLGVPLKGKSGVLGAIVNQCYNDPNCYTQKDIDLLETVSEQMAFAIEYKRAEAHLASTQKVLLEKAHKAGMADIASDTIHNLGSTLDNIKSFNNTTRKLLKESQLSNFNKAIKLLKDKRTDLKGYFRKDPGSESLMRYLLGIKHPLNREYNQIHFQTRRIADKVLQMTEVIRNQQKHVYEGTLEEESTIKDIVSHVLDFHQTSLKQHGIQIIRDFDDIPQILVNRAKLRHIIMNLIENARDAMYQSPNQNRFLSVTLSQNTEDIFLAFRDNGDGIDEKNLNRIFAHGFTTKPNGHGFGLHNCANLAISMKGTLWAESEGSGKGATFTLKFPKR